MVALPLSLGGALLGLMVAQKALGLYALIGIVLLLGIVTKNSICCRLYDHQPRRR
jgi:multidrug efflux pump subunit AcrB